MVNAAEEKHPDQAGLWRAADHLRIWPRRLRGRAVYVVEDRARNRFFRLGEQEYRFLCRLDRGEDPASAWRSVADVASEPTTPADDAAVPLSPALDSPRAARGVQLLQWLHQEGLATPMGRQTQPGAARPASSARDAKQAAGSPTPRVSGVWFALRVVLLTSRRWLDPFEQTLGPLFTRGGALAAGSLLLLAATIVLSRWTDFLAPWSLASPSQWLVLALAALMIKVLHEMGHAAACRRFGGEVAEAGVLLIFFAPLAFVDVSSAWRFSSRWRRVGVALAGAYVEMILGSTAVCVWALWPTSLAGEICRHLAWVTVASTLLINLNPLMRFDGYFVLADLTEQHNLYATSWRALRRLLQRGFKRQPVAAPVGQSVKQSAWLSVYGLLAVAWRVLVGGGICWSVAHWFGGWGVGLLVLAGVSWRRAWRRTGQSSGGRRAGRRISSVWVWPLLGSLGLLVAFACWQMPVSAPGVVEGDPTVTLRAGCAGVLREVHATPGQVVSEGQLLARIDCPELRQQTLDARYAERQSELTARRLQQQGLFAAAQAEAQQTRALSVRRQEFESRLAHAEVRAPIAGVILGRGWSHALGRYVELGQPLCEIANPETKKVRILIRSDQLEPFDANGVEATVTPSSGGRFRGRFRIERPTASRELWAPSLSAPWGGSTAVVRSDDGRALLLEPCFEATMRLDAEQSARLLAGERVQVTWRRSIASGRKPEASARE